MFLLFLLIPFTHSLSWAHAANNLSLQLFMNASEWLDSMNVAKTVYLPILQQVSVDLTSRASHTLKLHFPDHSSSQESIQSCLQSLIQDVMSVPSFPVKLKKRGYHSILPIFKKSPLFLDSHFSRFNSRKTLYNHYQVYHSELRMIYHFHQKQLKQELCFLNFLKIEIRVYAWFLYKQKVIDFGDYQVTDASQIFSFGEENARQSQGERFMFGSKGFSESFQSIPRQYHKALKSLKSNPYIQSRLRILYPMTLKVRTLGSLLETAASEYGKRNLQLELTAHVEEHQYYDKLILKALKALIQNEDDLINYQQHNYKLMYNYYRWDLDNVKSGFNALHKTRDGKLIKQALHTKDMTILGLKENVHRYTTQPNQVKSLIKWMFITLLSLWGASILVSLIASVNATSTI